MRPTAELRVVITSHLPPDEPILFDGGDPPRVLVSEQWWANADEAKAMSGLIDGLAAWVRQYGDPDADPAPWWNKRQKWLAARWSDAEVEAARADGCRDPWDYAHRWGVHPFVACSRIWVYEHRHERVCA